MQNAAAAAAAIAQAQAQGNSGAIAEGLSKAFAAGQASAASQALAQATGAPQDQAQSAATAIANAQSQVEFSFSLFATQTLRGITLSSSYPPTQNLYILIGGCLFLCFLGCVQVLAVVFPMVSIHQKCLCFDNWSWKVIYSLSCGFAVEL